MVAQWRALWSAAPGTTDALAPFGYVDIADGSDEAWGVSMAGLRWAQGANYGSVPNAALPNVFSAAAHDLGDVRFFAHHAALARCARNRDPNNPQNPIPTARLHDP